jgi:hypothetical protein
LLRWSAAAAAIAGWGVWPDPDTGAVIARTGTGVEYAGLARSGPDSEPIYLVRPDRGRWELIKAASGISVVMFRTLTEALEAVCKTTVAEVA